MPTTKRAEATTDSADILNKEIAADYTENMFKDGNNRAERNQKVRNAPDYDRAAHTPDTATEDLTAEVTLETAPINTFHSREGTDAAGKYDETGGPLGGSEEELDALEATATPVDRNPRMKD